jgi:hypothetical protein
MRRIVTGGVWLLITIQSASAQAVPLPKQGSGGCPAGYVQSGQLCVPSAPQTRVCVERRGGSCPANYVQTGDFCCRAGN